MSAFPQKAQIDKPPALPLVVLIGFAASSELNEKCYDPAFRKEIENRLRKEFKNPDPKLQFTANHFFCGLSRMSGEGDIIFTRTCQDEEIPQRIFLSQDLETRLVAEGFTEEQKSEIRGLVASPHVIQQRIVCRLNEPPEERELDVDFEIVSVCDIFICLANRASPGGSGDEDVDVICEAALRRGKPVLRLAPGKANAPWTIPTGVKPPALPPDLNLPHHLGLPEGLKPSPTRPGALEMHKLTRGELEAWAQPYRKALHDHGHSHSKIAKTSFAEAASRIVGAHLIATLLATIALKITFDLVLVMLLAVELTFLVAGFRWHRSLHHSDWVRHWAMSRVAAEIACSVDAMKHFHVSLDYLFQLPLPATLRPLLRTMHVFHLAATRGCKDPFEHRLRTYRLHRVLDQRKYYGRALRKAREKYRKATKIFQFATLGAMVATFWKLLSVLHLAPHGEPLPMILGGSAILLPVAAVGALSKAASEDLEARIHTFEDILSQIKIDLRLIKKSKSVTELSRLALITEARLLGETANWASRRSFTSIT